MMLTLRNGPPPLPREHGAWAMLITPPVLALAAAGPSWLGMMALLGWFTAYCVRGPVEVLRGHGASGRAGMARSTPEVARLWLLIFGGLTLVLLGPVLTLRPLTGLLLLVAAGLMGIVQAMADRGKARTISAGMIAVTGLMVGAPLYYVAAMGAVPAQGWALAGACAAFFAGSILRVKTLGRERSSVLFRMSSVLLHLGVQSAAIVAALAGSVPSLFPVALVAPTIWAIYGALRAGRPVNLMVIGKGEQWLTITFGLLLIAAFRL